jgi:hypothetical protein
MLGLGLWIWSGSPFKLKEEIFPRRFATVEAGRLYRSGRIAERLVPGVLDEYRIGLVLDLTPPSSGLGRKARRQRAESDAAEDRGIRHIRVSLRGDGTGAPLDYARAIAYLARAYRDGTPALVHCGGGRRRSAGVVAAFQLLVQGRSTRVVGAELQRFLSAADAAPIARYLNSNIETIATSLIAEGVLEDAAEIPRIEVGTL